MEQSNQLNLKTAISLIDEVEVQIEPFKKMIDDLDQSSSNSSDDGFVMTVSKGAWDGFKGGLQIRKESVNLLQKCDQAIQLSTAAKSSNPQITLIQKHDGSDIVYTPEMLIGYAHLAKGVVHLVSSNFIAAQQSLRQSLNVFPTAEGQLRLGYAILGEGQRNEALLAFRKVLNDYSDSEEAVEANKVILELDRIKPKNWTVALLLSIFLGWAGIDRFYLGYTKDGFIKFITAGGVYIWWIVDIIRIATNKLRDANGLKLQK
ncbi:MAG: TM2 domain-containing protein [Bacteroidetes bacterium]|nr:TM2 domain-containing protein [Bacteroidota bacterium]MCL5027987.1 TM2 domain-containing protein [Bacteroidota bacterium]